MHYTTRWLRLTLSLALAGLGMLLVLGLSPRAASQAAPTTQVTPPCSIRFVTVTASLGRAPGVSETLPTGAFSRTLFFAPGEGRITLTVSMMDIVSATTWHLYAGPAFGRALTATFELTQAHPRLDVAYPVTTGHTTTQVVHLYAWPEGGTASLPCYSLSFVPDDTSPTVVSPTMATAAPHLYAGGTTLYYTDTHGVGEFFELSGRSADSGSGLARTSFGAINLGCGPVAPSDSMSNSWSAEYCLRDLPQPGVITVTAYDHVGHAHALPFSFEPDGVPPTSTLTTTVPITRVPGLTPVSLTWMAADTGSGVYSVTLLYKSGDNEWQAYADIKAHGRPTGTFVFIPPIAPAKPVTYAFGVLARDNLGNRQSSPTSAGVEVLFWPNRFEVYLPGVFKNAWLCTPLDLEPNDTFDQAQILPLSGALPRRSNAIGNFCPGDQADYFVFTTTGKLLSATLAIPAGVNLDLYGYDVSRQPVFVSTASSGEHVLKQLPPGRYFLKVQAAEALGQAHSLAYQLQIEDLCLPVDAEPNNTFAQAQTLLLTGVGTKRGSLTGNFCPDDPVDYFAMTTAGQFLSVALTLPVGVELGLYGYDEDYVPVFTATVSGHKSLLVASRAGRHYLKVLPVGAVDLPHTSPYVIAVEDIPQPLANGDFEQAGWGGWGHGRGAFAGNGSGLPQSVVTYGNSRRALLGTPDYDDKNGSIPVGYGYISQTFYVPPRVPTLTLSYRVRSFDTVYGLGSKQYFDTFEVSLNKLPTYIMDSERNGSCLGTALNPDDITRTPSGDGLVMCGGAPPTSNPAAWDSGWRTLRLDLSAYAGMSVTLYAAVWSREYESPSTDDKAQLNTYVYLDEVWMTIPPYASALVWQPLDNPWPKQDRPGAGPKVVR